MWPTSLDPSSSNRSSGKPGSTSPAKADAVLDLAIIGGGVSGVSAAIEAKRAALNFRIFEATQPFSTVANFPKAKPIYTYPTDLKLEGGLQFSTDVKEALLEELEEQRKAAGVEFTEARIERIESRGKEILLNHGDKAKTITRARRVVVAIGRSGNHRRLGCPGEDLDKVYNRLYDPKDFSGKNVLVVGGGDSALECAIALAGSGAKVTVSYRKPEFARPKSENVEKLKMLEHDPKADCTGGATKLGAGDDRVHERDDEKRAARLGYARDADGCHADRNGQGDPEAGRWQRDRPA